MATIIQILIGALACAVFVLFVRQVRPAREAIIYAVALAVAALIYVGFAALGNARSSELVLESGGLVLFSLIALLGVRFNAWFLTLGWAAHALWDVLLHRVVIVGFVPEWYSLLCLGFDVFLAAYITIGVTGSRWLGATLLTSRSAQP